MLAIACLTCLTFGLIPAWRASRVAAVDAMKATVRSGSSAEGLGLRRLLVVAQVACSLVLLFGGLLFAGTLRNLLAVDTGFQSRNVSVARVNFSGMVIPPATRRALTEQVLERNPTGSRHRLGSRGTARSVRRHREHHDCLWRGHWRDQQEHHTCERDECGLPDDDGHGANRGS